MKVIDIKNGILQAIPSTLGGEVRIAFPNTYVLTVSRSEMLEQTNISFGFELTMAIDPEKNIDNSGVLYLTEDMVLNIGNTKLAYFEEDGYIINLKGVEAI